MKARIQIPSYYENDIEERISSLEAESRARIHEEVMKERHDIAMRTTYLCLLARYQVGLNPSTLVRIQEAMGPVAKKYSDYRADKLADVWAQATLQNIGVNVEETEEPF